MKADLPNEWHLLKVKGTTDLIINKSRLPYFVQAFEVEIEKVILLARVKNNPANFSINIDGTATNLSRIAELKLCKGDTTDIDLDKSFKLAIDQPHLVNLEELLIVVKYKPQ